VAVRRFDVAGRCDQVETTPQGGLRVPAVPTRSGIFPYTDDRGVTRLEYRPPEEVFARDSLDTLRAAPVTDLHPAQRVDATNWRSLAVGHVDGMIIQDGHDVSATLVIQDAVMVAKVQAGERHDLSCGYVCDLEMSPGQTTTGERYDAIQRRIRYNHVALGPKGWGRQGPESSLRLDSGDAIQTERNVEKETIDGIEYVVGSPEHVKALRQDRDKAKGRADAAEAKAKAPVVIPPPPPAATIDPKVVHKMAQERADLLVMCHQVAASKGVKYDAKAAEGASSEAIMAELIGMIDPNFDVTGKTPEYLAGALTMMVRTLAGSPSAGGGSNPEVPPPPADAVGSPVPAPVKTDSARSIFGARAGTEPVKTPDQNREDDQYNSDKAQKEMLANSHTRWKRPLAMSKDSVTK